MVKQRAILFPQLFVEGWTIYSNRKGKALAVPGFHWKPIRVTLERVPERKTARGVALDE